MYWLNREGEGEKPLGKKSEKQIRDVTTAWMGEGEKCTTISLGK